MPSQSGEDLCRSSATLGTEMRNRGGRILAVEAKSVAVHDDGLKS